MHVSFFSVMVAHLLVRGSPMPDNLSFSDAADALVNTGFRSVLEKVQRDEQVQAVVKEPGTDLNTTIVRARDIYVQRHGTPA